MRAAVTTTAIISQAGWGWCGGSLVVSPRWAWFPSPHIHARPSQPSGATTLPRGVREMGEERKEVGKGRERDYKMDGHKSEGDGRRGGCQ